MVEECKAWMAESAVEDGVGSARRVEVSKGAREATRSGDGGTESGERSGCVSEVSKRVW